MIQEDEKNDMRHTAKSNFTKVNADVEFVTRYSLVLNKTIMERRHAYMQRFKPSSCRSSLYADLKLILNTSQWNRFPAGQLPEQEKGAEVI